MSNPINHHILPKCYLKGFVDQKGQIWTAKIQGPITARIRFSQPSGTAYLKNYFTINKERPLGIPFYDDPLIIEKKINHFYENKLPKLWSELVTNSGQISVNTKFEIAQTIFHVKMRCRKSRSLFFAPDQMEKLMHTTIAEISVDQSGIGQKVMQELGLTPDQYKTLFTKLYKEVILDTGDEGQFHNGYLLKTNFEPGPARKNALWRLVQANWTVFHAQGNDSFLLGDNPGNSIDDNREVFNFFGRQKFDFYFPINSKTCLRINAFSRLLTPDNIVRVENEEISSADVDKINLISLAGAFLEIYGDSENLLKSSRENMQQKFAKKENNLAQVSIDWNETRSKLPHSSLWK